MSTTPLPIHIKATDNAQETTESLSNLARMVYKHVSCVPDDSKRGYSLVYDQSIDPDALLDLSGWKFRLYSDWFNDSRPIRPRNEAKPLQGSTLEGVISFRQLAEICYLHKTFVYDQEYELFSHIHLQRSFRGSKRVIVTFVFLCPELYHPIALEEALYNEIVNTPPLFPGHAGGINYQEALQHFTNC